MSLGFMQAGFRVLAANEIDSTIATAYSANHPGTLMINEDITRLDPHTAFADFKNRTVGVIGGPPCQGFSMKGQRQTLHDDRNYLFRYFINVVRCLEPEFFVMENVPALLTAAAGQFREEFTAEYRDMGYSVSMSVLNAADYGVPQVRRRAIVVGHRSGMPIPLPPAIRERTTVRDAISDLAFLESGQGRERQPYPGGPQTQYQCEMRRETTVLTNHVATSHSALALERLRLIAPEKGREQLPQHHRTRSIHSGTWSRLRWDEPAVTITTRFDTPSSGRFTHPELDRAITVREAARIQSFPDDFRFIGTKTSQMKQVGNAVPPRLGLALAQSIATRVGTR